MEAESIIIIFVIVFFVFIWNLCFSRKTHGDNKSGGDSQRNSKNLYPDLKKETSFFSSMPTNGKGSTFSAIIDRFHTLEQVKIGLRDAGLESSNLIFGIDYTASNQYQGTHSFHGKSLHCLEPTLLNPYQQVISTLGETLADFDEDGVIPAFGFGDISTKDKLVFPFKQNGYCIGFRDVLECYNQITPMVKLSGPTCFAPLIYKAIEIVKVTKAYHILVIVADGQVTSEQRTANAIVEASNFPLSIIMVGVGDGPWNQMRDFDDRLPRRTFDNFQFVDFHDVRRSSNRNVEFATRALMEIPDQFKTIRRLGLLDF